MTQVLVSVGSNQNDPQKQIQTAFMAIRDQFGRAQISKLYLTEPVGIIPQNEFINAAISFKTQSNSSEVLAYLMQLEVRAGRDRSTEVHHGPRNLDLDIILFGDEIHDDAELQVPHPRFRERRFVLEPLLDIAADQIDPVSKQSISQLFHVCSDTSWVRKMDEELLAV